jgi:DNA-3-methyladenine glycosylase II
VTAPAESAYAALAAADPVLAELIEEVGQPDPFEFTVGERVVGSNFAAMVLHILSQQISTRVAFVLYDRLVLAAGGTLTPEAVLRLGPDELRALGASRAKASYLHSLAEQVDSGALDIERMTELTDSRAVSALTAVRGIGPWSAEMFLILQLHRTDILPADDLGIRAAVRKAWALDTLPPGREVRQRGVRWAPYRTYATALLWRSLAPPALP